MRSAGHHTLLTRGAKAHVARRHCELHCLGSSRLRGCSRVDDATISHPAPVGSAADCGNPLIAVSVYLTYRTVKKTAEGRNDEGTATVVVRFVGAAVVFLGGFAVVTAWQAAAAGIDDVQREFSSLTAIAQDTRTVTTEESVEL